MSHPSVDTTSRNSRHVPCHSSSIEGLFAVFIALNDGLVIAKAVAEESPLDATMPHLLQDTDSMEVFDAASSLCLSTLEQVSRFGLGKCRVMTTIRGDQIIMTMPLAPFVITAVASNQVNRALVKLALRDLLTRMTPLRLVAQEFAVEQSIEPTRTELQN